MIKKLKVAFPMATAFPHQATLLSILQAYDECKDWIFSNYIQIFSAKKFNEGPGVIAKFDFFYNLYADYRYFELRTNPWLQYYKMPLYMVLQYDSICKFLIERINNDEYAWLPISRSYIKKYGSSGFHVQFIYGYDTEEQIFYCGDNYIGKYSFEKIPFSEIEAAVRNVTDQADSDLGTEGVTFLKYYYLPKWNEKFSRYTFNKAKVINDIKEYLLFDDYGMGYRCNDFYSFGVECYDAMLDYWKYKYNSFNQDRYIDLRAISSFVDHKNIMVKRIEYMTEKNILHENDFIQKFREIYNDMLEVRAILIKANVMQSFPSGMLKKVTDLFCKCKDIEIYVLNELLTAMES